MQQTISKESSKIPLKIAIVSLPENDFRFPIIGTLIITKYVKEHCKNVTVRLYDNTFDDVLAELARFKPDIVGFTTFTQSYKKAIAFGKKVKAIFPDVKIVFDFGVIGEGEQTFVELIKKLQSNQSVKKIQGLIYHEKDIVKKTERRKASNNIDHLFPIDYSLLNPGYFKTKFIPEVYSFGVSCGMMTSIGCPYDCRFCSIKACWRTIRFRAIENVVDEIKTLYHDYGVRHIDFFDDLFSINKARLQKLREELKKSNLLGKVTFSCQARANTIDEEMCALLQSLNVKTVVFGFESGSDRILRYVKKDETLSAETNRNAMRLCIKHKLNVAGCLMIGMPTEKLEDMKKTLDFIDYGKRIGVMRLWLQILIPLPSTEFWDIAKQRGKLEGDFYEYLSDFYHKESPLLLDPDIKVEEFVKIYSAAKKKCRSFVYTTFMKTLINDPKSFLYFSKEGFFYLKRFVNFVKQ